MDTGVFLDFMATPKSSPTPSPASLSSVIAPHAHPLTWPCHVGPCDPWPDSTSWHWDPYRHTQYLAPYTIKQWEFNETALMRPGHGLTNTLTIMATCLHTSGSLCSSILPMIHSPQCHQSLLSPTSHYELCTIPKSSYLHLPPSQSASWSLLTWVSVTQVPKGW